MSSTTLVFSLGVSFILGYLFSYLNFFQALASIFTDYSSIQNKFIVYIYFFNYLFYSYYNFGKTFNKRRSQKIKGISISNICKRTTCSSWKFLEIYLKIE